MITYNSVLTSLTRKFGQKDANFYLNLRKRPKRVYIFSQNSISDEEVPMITYNAVLTDLLRIFCHKAQKLLLDVQKIQRKESSSSKNFYPKCFYGHVTCNFYNGAHQKNCSKSQKGRNIEIFRKKFFSHKNVPKVTYNADFTILQTKIFLERRKFFAHRQNLIEKKDICKKFCRFFFRTLQLSSAHVDCIFTASSNTFCQKVEF